MALIRCKFCGKPVSDRAAACPHCGHGLKEGAIPESQNDPQPQEQEVYKPQNSSGKGGSLLLAIAILLIIIALGVTGFIAIREYNHHRKWDISTYSDSCGVAVDSDTINTIADSSNWVENNDYSTNECVAADSTPCVPEYNDNYEEEDAGFQYDQDVIDFVDGKTYTYNGNTLRISEKGVYYNGEDISSTYPRIVAISKNVGRVTAEPSVNITVRRDGDKLIILNNEDIDGTLYYSN